MNMPPHKTSTTGSKPAGFPGLGGCARGFTLVELLIVIGIIAVLIGILLPALAVAKRTAETAKCLANLRALAQGMVIYATDNRGAIIGTGATTGLAMFPPNSNTNAAGASPLYTATNVPGDAPIYPSDYFAPFIQELRIPTTTHLDPSASDRYAEYMTLPQFQCPAYSGVTQIANSGTTGGTVRAISYTMAWAMQLNQSFSNGGLGITGVNRISDNNAVWPQPPGQYTPKYSKIGNSSQKVFMADGAKFFSTLSTAHKLGSYDLSIPGPSSQWYNDTDGSNGMYADLGPWTTCSSAYDRSHKPGNGASPISGDPRFLAFRHGSGRNDGLRINLVFMDGHAENMDELKACNPIYWLPTGSTLPTSGIWADVVKKYQIVANATTTVP
jgi:prepilin-type N-terminal cleavage/methylation domain-containing protein